MPISLTILLVLAGVALLAFGFGSIGGALRFLSGGAALVVAILATAATVYLFWIGQKAHWTSDGPGMLFVMIAIVVCAIAAVLGWMFVFGIAATVFAPVESLPDAPAGVKRVLRLLGFAALAIAAAGQGITAYTGRGRAAHSAPVVAVSFAGGRERLVTVDAAGTLVDWDLQSKREARRETRPELAGVTELFVDAAAARGFAIANGKALTFVPFADTPVDTIPGARHIAGGASVVIATERALLFAPYSNWPLPPDRELAWTEPITAVAARDMFVAVADPVKVSLLDGRRDYLRVMASVPAPGPIRALEVLSDGTVIALDGGGAGWTIDVRRGVTEPLAEASLVAGARLVFLVAGRAVSEYHPQKKTTTRVATIGSGTRAIDTWDKYLAFGLEDGEVVLGTRTGATLETERLTAKPKD